MAWFWSPKYKRKYEIVGFKTKDEITNPKEVGFSKIIRIYYKDERGEIDFTQVPNDNNVIYKGLKQYCKENKVNINRTYKHWKGY